MKVVLSWLREFCPTVLPPAEVADRLTAQGVEIEEVLHPWERLQGVIIARILDVRDHPKADKLSLATIDAGGVERHVVVGVRNYTVGDLVPYAPPGATLPGVDFTLEAREIRGERSEGMLCSPKELGISTDHGGILVLTGQPGMEPGADVREALGLDGAVIDVATFPNRPDLLSVYGVAREVAAATGEDLAEPDVSVTEGGEKATGAATVEVRDAERCPRYLARVIRGVRVGPSPLHVQIRLGAAGMRPLSNVVDATNYALLELGHPLHPFDLAKLGGGGIVVRRAEEGERLTTLDDVERTLTAEDLLIADHERGVAIAGVMGSAPAEVGEGTKDVLLESAYFQPLEVLRTARRLGLRTEANVRFERGADPEAVPRAAARAARLIAEWSGGTVLAGEIDVGDAPARATVAMRPARASLLLGMDVTAADARAAFDRLRLPSREEGDAVLVEVPGYRVDLEREADLIEEVGRVHGYGEIPSTLPGVRQAGGLTRDQRAHRRMRDALAAVGLLEARSSTFSSARDLSLYADARAEGISVSNPVSEDEAFLRTGLLPGLLAAVRRNASYRNRTVRLFEAGHVFRTGPTEEDHVAALLAGAPEESWPGRRDEHDFLDAKGVVEALMGALGVAEWSLGESLGGPYHPGRSAAVLISGQTAGEIGELHPRVVEANDLTGRVAAFELRTEPLLAAAASVVSYNDVSRFPPVHRDLAFVVDRSVPAGQVRRALAEAAGELLEHAVLFDVYEGHPLPEGKVSLAFAVDLRAKDRTLTDDEAEERVAAIAARLAADFGAELRSG